MNLNHSRRLEHTKLGVISETVRLITAEIAAILSGEFARSVTRHNLGRKLP